MNPTNQQKLDKLKAALPPRSRAADLWDAMGVDEREVRKRQFVRGSIGCEGEALPVNVRNGWDFQSWRGQRAIARMLKPVMREADRIARNGCVVSV